MQKLALSRFLVLALALTTLSGCKTIGGWFGGEEKQEVTETLGVEALYAESKALLDKGNYDRAATYLQRLIARFPFGEYTEQAQVDLAYAYYKSGKPEDAINAIDRFIRTYPTNSRLDYLYYLRGLVNFDRTTTFFSRLIRQDTSARDTAWPRQSFDDFAIVTNRYPNSAYAADSAQRMVWLRNLLARHEYGTALFYFRREAYVSAANRAQYLIENYPQSEFQNDAVALMAASYKALGQSSLEQDARKVLAANEPNHPYLTEKRWPPKRKVWRQLNPFAGELQK